MQKSLWQDTVRLPAFGRLEGEIQTDVLIVGGGLAGLLCAWQLKAEGVECVLIEADRICRGITGNTTAKVTSQHGLCYHRLLRTFGPELTRMYYDANEAALSRLRMLAGEIPCGFQIQKNGIYARRPLRKLEEEWNALEKLEIPAVYSKHLPLPVEAEGCILFPNQASFHPLKLAAGLARGLRIYEQTPAREFQPGRVVTDSGVIRAEKTIVATHFPLLNKHGMYFLKLYQNRSYVLALENAQPVDGMYLDAEPEGLSFRGWGDLLLLGGGSHRTGKPAAGWKPLEEFAQIHYPQGTVKYRWAAQDCMSLDGVPYIGRYSSNTPDLFVATGFNKWGMTSSMVSAMLLTDLVQGRENPWAQLYAPSRGILRPQLLRNAAESARNLLTPTKPRCPHMGCALKWNPRERSWDCPCHGSRFSEDGNLLDNPATGDADL